MVKKISEILIETRSSKGFNKSEMARQLGISSQLYTQYEKGSVVPKTDFRKNFEEKFGISLIEVENNYSIKKKSGEELRLQKAIGKDEDPNELGLIYVPIAAQAGYSRNFSDPVFVNQLERLYIPGLPYKGDNFRYFDVEGESMEPTLEEGMQVIGQKVNQEDWKHISDYYIYVIITMNQVLIKRLFKKDERSFILISDHEDLYPQFQIDIENIKELWLVKRKLDWNMTPPKRFEIKI